MPEDRRWSDAELVLVWDTLGDVRHEQGSTEQAAAVLDALTAAGKLRADAAADILAEVDGLRGYADDYLAGMRRAAAIARGDTDG